MSANLLHQIEISSHLNNQINYQLRNSPNILCNKARIVKPSMECTCEPQLSPFSYTPSLHVPFLVWSGKM
jgi:hypothetical protein